MQSYETVHDLPLICHLGESDFELRGLAGKIYTIWSESCQKGVDFTDISGDAIEVATRLLRASCAKYRAEPAKLARFLATVGERNAGK